MLFCDNFISRVFRKEVGWGGHFIGVQDCLFRRNTHLRQGEKIIVISTIGNYRPYRTGNTLGEIEIISADAYYETMVFYADSNDKVYFDADISRPIKVYTNNHITAEMFKKTETPDIDANRMHELIVKEVKDRLENGLIK